MDYKSFIHRIIFATLSIAVTMLPSGCNSDAEYDITARQVTLNFIPSVAGNANVSRALPVIHDGTTIISDTIGMWLCHQPASYDPYSIGTDNMECSYNFAGYTPDWTFKYGEREHKVLSVKPLNEEYDDFYIYAYSPYDANAESPEAIPVETAGKQELIYIKPIHRQSKNVRDTIDIPLKFIHAQACIELYIRTAHSAASLYLTELGITDNSEGNPILPLSSEFNTITESYNDSKTIYGKTLKLSGFKKYLQQTSTNTYAYIHIYIPLIPFSGYTDDRFTLEFNFGTMICKFRLPAINPDENGSMDFLQGYKYVYNLIFENGMLFKSGAIVTSDWTDEETKKFDI